MLSHIFFLGLEAGMALVKKSITVTDRQEHWIRAFEAESLETAI